MRKIKWYYHENILKNKKKLGNTPHKNMEKQKKMKNEMQEKPRVWKNPRMNSNKQEKKKQKTKNYSPTHTPYNVSGSHKKIQKQNKLIHHPMK